MSNKGYAFEAYVTDFFKAAFSNLLKGKNKIFRIIGSGRNKFATRTGGGGILEGDVSIELEFLPKNILIECKHHKSKTIEKSFTVKKEWVDQALSEANKNGRWSVVAIRFKSSSENAVHYIIPEEHFLEMLKFIELISTKLGINYSDGLNNLSNSELLTELSKRLETIKCLKNGENESS